MKCNKITLTSIRLHFKNHPYDQIIHRDLSIKFVMILLNIYNHNHIVKIINIIHKIGTKKFEITILQDIHNMHNNQIAVINVVLLDTMLGIVPVPISGKGSNDRWCCFQYSI